MPFLLSFPPKESDKSSAKTLVSSSVVRHEDVIRYVSVTKEYLSFLVEDGFDGLNLMMLRLHVSRDETAQSRLALQFRTAGKTALQTR